MTRSAYLWRRVQRERQKQSRGEWPSVNLFLALLDLEVHVDAKVRPSMTDTVWRSKRDGGPLRLDFGHIESEAA
jgi:hypothetical protein